MPVPKIVDAIQKHRVLISTGGKDVFEVSSGTLVRINDLTFILTAAHNLNELKNRTLFINLGIPFHNCTYMIKKIWTDNNFDFSYIEIDTEECEKYRKEIVPVFLQRIAPPTALAPKYRAVAIIGYPFKNVKLYDVNKKYEAKTTYILSQLLKNEKWPANIDKSKSDFMLIEYGEKYGQQFIDQNGEIVNKPNDPSGLSGSAIWKFDPETMNNEKPAYALWGIQNSWFEKSQLLCGTFIGPLINQIISDYKIDWNSERPVHGAEEERAKTI